MYSDNWKIAFDKNLQIVPGQIVKISNDCEMFSVKVKSIHGKIIKGSNC